MRLWSFHPVHLLDDDLGLLWSDGLKAAHALVGLRRGQRRAYANHPQLERFRAQPNPVQAISDYLHAVLDEIERRGLRERRFKRGRIPHPRRKTHMAVTAGQIEFEVWHYGALLVKGKGNGQAYCDFFSVAEHLPHSTFRIVSGAIEKWEKLSHDDYTQCAKCGDPVGKNSRGQPRKYCEFCRPSAKRKRRRLP